MLISDDDIEQVFRFGSPVEVHLRSGESKFVRTTGVTPQKLHFFHSNRLLLNQRGIVHRAKWKGAPGEMEFAWWLDKPTLAQERREEAMAASKAVESDFHVPMGGGIVLRPYQAAGVEYMLKVTGNLSNAHQALAHANRRLPQNSSNAGSGQKITGQDQVKSGIQSSPQGTDQKAVCRSGMAREGVQCNAESDALSGSQKSSPGIAGASPPPTWNELQRRKRAADDTRSADGDGGVRTSRVPAGVCDPNEGTRNEASTPNQLQGGLRKSNDQNSGGIGRTGAQLGSSGDRQEENRGAHSSGLASASHPAREGGDARPFRLSPGGFLLADEMG
jgi:hypothetical protein